MSCAIRPEVLTTIEGLYETGTLDPDHLLQRVPKPNINDSHFNAFPDTDLTMNKHCWKRPLK